MSVANHRAGFISLVGLPNTGKSTLLNTLVGKRLSITTAKPQTTRHNILGIVNTADTQCIYTDTPGFLTPSYPLQKLMLKAAQQALVGTDIVLWMVDSRRTPSQATQDVLWKKLKHISVPVFVVLNKIDIIPANKVASTTTHWTTTTNLPVIPISALKHTNMAMLQAAIRDVLPVHPPYYPKDALTAQSERFLAGEMIREQIFLNYRQEIPYHTAVQVQQFKEESDLLRIAADILVTHPRQKPILIGTRGKRLEKISIGARKQLAAFFKKKIFLKLYITAKPTWRHSTSMLKSLGHR